MSADPVTSSTDGSPKKASWLSGKRIVVILLIAIVAGSLAAAGIYTSTMQPTPSKPVVCNNGATNYPSCTACQSGQTLTGGSCQNNCTNGALNPTACNTCPSGQVIVSGSCVRNCSNGTSNPPACDNVLRFSIDYSPHSPNVGQEVSFYVLNRLGGITPVYFTWTFGDVRPE